MNRLSTLLRAIGVAIAAIVVFFSGAWGTLALWYQLPGGKPWRALGAGLWAVLIIGLLSLHSMIPLMAYAAAQIALLIWWSTIAPSNDRIWSDDVAQLLTGTVHDHTATLTGVRNFSWREEHDYDVRWETRQYDLDQLSSADAMLSYWASASIAHAMISFGFDDGKHIVFSVEIRKKRGQEFSGIGGFFKQFEMILIAADESDIIRVRTNVRREDDYLFPLVMDKAAMRSLFVSYIDAANVLAREPAFYNTVTSNCTTIVYRMAKRLDPGLPMDIRLLMTGYLPEYLYENGALDRGIPLDEWRRRGRITERARGSSPGDDFSAVIRS